jgi:DNA polymerase-3 subunit delta'
MVGADGQLPMPWLAEPLREAQMRQGHALLVHGPEGVGQFELSLALAQAWLCESPSTGKPCGTCPSCHLTLSHTHPDLLVLLPEALRDALGWSMGDDGEGAAAEKAGKAKPSKEIKVEAVRTAVAFAQTTSARGRGKVVVVHPAERMNGIAANALLKTLEEPPGNARFILSCSAPQALLPTIRSRCQALPLHPPATEQACEWLASRKLAQPEVLLAATGGQPQEALEWAGQGIDAALWTGLPRQLARGEVGLLGSWPLPRLVDMLQKLCHDAMRHAAGAAPRYFPPGSLPDGLSASALSHWSRELQRVARHAEHPWSAALLVESLVMQARKALAAQPKSGKDRQAGPAANGLSVHSPA